MGEIESEAGVHRLIGGALCLDFANTLNGHARRDGHEYIHSFRDLVLWSQHAGSISTGDARSLHRRGARQAREAKAVLKRALALRETVYRIFVALSQRRSPSKADLARWESVRLEALAHSRISRAGGEFRSTWSEPVALERVLWPIALSVGELLTSGKLGRVRECDGDRCDWLFLDTSRNHMRRWCSMDECGARAKSHRHYARVRRLARLRESRHAVTRGAGQTAQEASGSPG